MPFREQIDIFRGVLSNADKADIPKEHPAILQNFRPHNGRLQKTFKWGDGGLRKITLLDPAYRVQRLVTWPHPELFAGRGYFNIQISERSGHVNFDGFVAGSKTADEDYTALQLYEDPYFAPSGVTFSLSSNHHPLDTGVKTVTGTIRGLSADSSDELYYANYIIGFYSQTDIRYTSRDGSSNFVPYSVAASDQSTGSFSVSRNLNKGIKTARLERKYTALSISDVDTGAKTFTVDGRLGLPLVEGSREVVTGSTYYVTGSTGSITYNGTSYSPGDTILGVAAADDFTAVGDGGVERLPDFYDECWVQSSTGNDAYYRIQSSTYDSGADETTVIVRDAIADATADGNLFLIKPVAIAYISRDFMRSYNVPYHGPWNYRLFNVIGEQGWVYDVGLKIIVDCARGEQTNAENSLTTLLKCRYPIFGGTLDGTKIGGDSENSSWSSENRTRALACLDGVLFASANEDIWKYDEDSTTWTRVVENNDMVTSVTVVRAMVAWKGRIYFVTGGTTTSESAILYEWDDAGSVLAAKHTFASDTTNAIMAHGDYLYIGSGSSGDAAVHRWDGSTMELLADDTDWGNGANRANDLVIWDNALYVGIGGGTADGEIWKIPGLSGTPVKFAGDGSSASWTSEREVWAMAVYDGKLYASVANTPIELWEYDPDLGLWVQLDFEPPATSTDMGDMYTWNGKLWLGTAGAAGDAELWEFDGKDFLNRTPDSWGTGGVHEDVHEILACNNRLYIGLGDSSGDGEVHEMEFTTAGPAARGKDHGMFSFSYYVLGYENSLLGQQLLDAGSFNASIDWTVGADWVISGGKASHTAGLAGSLYQIPNEAIIEDEEYTVIIEVSGYSAESFTPEVGGTAGTAIDANGTHTQTIRAGSGGTLELVAHANGVFSIDKITLQRNTERLQDPNRYFRTGGCVGWPGMALGFYLTKYPAGTLADEAETALRDLLDWAITNVLVDDPTHRQRWSFRGGFGTYDVGSEEYTFTAGAIAWVSIEHAIDMLEALKYADDLGIVSNTKYTYNELWRRLDQKLFVDDWNDGGFWLPEAGRALQGIQQIAITDADTTLGEFKVPEDITGFLPAGRTFQVFGSKDNDAFTYTVVSATYNSGDDKTEIAVEESLTSESATGNIVYADSDHALDVASWYAAVAAHFGHTERARVAMAYAHEHYYATDEVDPTIQGLVFALPTDPFTGNPSNNYSAANPNAPWVEGTGGGVLAWAVLGEGDFYQSYIDRIQGARTSNNQWLYTTQAQTPLEMTDFEAATGSNWMVLIDDPASFWGSDNLNISDLVTKLNATPRYHKSGHNPVVVADHNMRFLPGNIASVTGSCKILFADAANNDFYFPGDQRDIFVVGRSFVISGDANINGTYIVVTVALQGDDTKVSVASIAADSTDATATLTDKARGLWAGYIDRKYFDDLYEPDADFYVYDSRCPAPVLEDLNFVIEKRVAPASSGFFANGDDQFYRMAYVYDGVQRSRLSEPLQVSFDGDQFADILFTVTSASHNLRITALEVYRSDTRNGTYLRHQVVDFLRPDDELHEDSSGGYSGRTAVHIPALSDFTFDGDNTYKIYVFGDNTLREIDNPQAAATTGSGHDVFVLASGDFNSGEWWNAQWVMTEDSGGGDDDVRSGQDGAYAGENVIIISEDLEDDGNDGSIIDLELGVTDSITGASDGGNGQTTFACAGHGLSANDEIVQSGFSTNTAYNGTFKVVSVNANDYDLAVPYGSSESGTWTFNGPPLPILESKNKALRLDSALALADEGEDRAWKLHVPHLGMWGTALDSGVVTFRLYDTNLLADGAEHSYPSTPSTDVNGAFAKMIGNRLWQADVILDPENKAEALPMGITYSEEGQPDITPSENLIALALDRGGLFTGLEELFQRVVIATDQSFVVINQSAAILAGNQDLIEIIPRIGNVAKRGMIAAGGSLFVVSHDGIYRLRPNNLAESDSTPSDQLLVSDEIGDYFETLTEQDRQDARGGFDARRREVVYVLGAQSWSYNIDREEWRRVDVGSTPGFMGEDEKGNIQIHDLGDNTIKSSRFDDPTTGKWRSHDLVISDERPEVVRWATVRYKSSEALTLNMYAEGAETADKTKTLPIKTTEGQHRVALKHKAKRFNLEIESPSSNLPAEIYSIEVDGD